MGPKDEEAAKKFLEELKATKLPDREAAKKFVCAPNVDMKAVKKMFGIGGNWLVV